MRTIMLSASVVAAFSVFSTVYAQTVPVTVQSGQALQVDSVIGAALIGLLGAIVGALMAAGLTQYVERRKNIEAFRSVLLEKRVDVALQVQSALNEAVVTFNEGLAECKSTDEVIRHYRTQRRQILVALSDAAFTNVLIYGYVQGLIHSNLLHDAEKSDLLGRGTLSDAKMNLRRVLSFLTTAYSFALLHSTQAVWEVDPDVERLKSIEEMAKSDVQRWYDEQRDMRRFKFTFETTSNQQLLTMVSLR